jgi:hypothetical protein
VAAVGELGDIECDNGRDDDGDSYQDCDDPDCWSSDVCARGIPAKAPPVKSPPTTTPNDEQPIAPAAPDAAPPHDDADSGTLDPTAADEADAAVEIGAEMRCGVERGPVCVAPESCILGDCSEGETYLLRVTGGFMPEHPDPAGVLCFDSVLDGCGSGVNFTCKEECAPDPYVVIELNGKYRGETPVVRDEILPRWNQEPIPVDLKAGDRLRLVVYDADPNTSVLTPDTKMFECWPDLTRPGVSGVVQCWLDPKHTGSQSPNVTIEFSPGP